MSKPRKNFSKVEVRWLDTVGMNHGWRTPEHYITAGGTTMRKMVTFGLLIHDDKSGIMVAQSGMVGNGNVDHVMSIPRGQVVRIIKLKTPK